MEHKRRIRCVILDVDGTLIDSNDAHAASWVDTLHEAGYDVRYDRVRQLIGKGGDKLLPEVSGITVDSPEGKRLTERRSEIFNSRYLSTIRAFPATRELLQHIRAGGLKLVVASSAQAEELQTLLAIAGAADLVEEKKSSGDAKESKPDPDIVAVALQDSGCDAPDAVMLGDTPYDIEAASRCGVATIAVRCGGWDDASLAGALAIYDGPADLLAHYDESPLGPALQHG